MTELSFQQAIRNAVAAENAAARYYRALAALDVEERVREFLYDMAKQEDAHARSIEETGRRLTGGELPEQPDMDVSTVEAAPEWLIADDISLAQAVEIARDNEHKASLYYDTLADFCQEQAADFFHKLAETEMDHARKLEQFQL
jgi:rubrerythrin